MKLNLTVCALWLTLASSFLHADEINDLVPTGDISASATQAETTSTPTPSPITLPSINASAITAKPSLNKASAPKATSAPVSKPPKAKAPEASSVAEAEPDFTPAQDLLLSAMSLIGVKYKWGGNTPQSGLDCSGFIKYVFGNSLNIVLPRTALGMSKIGDVIDKDELKPGDLVFFNTLKRKFSHVGIYLGDNRFIHAPRKGRNIEITDFDNSYWTSRFNGARRIQELGDKPIDLQALIAANPTPPPGATLGKNTSTSKSSCRKVTSTVKGKKVTRTVCSSSKPTTKKTTSKPATAKKSTSTSKKTVSASAKKPQTTKAPVAKKTTHK